MTFSVYKPFDAGHLTFASTKVVDFIHVSEYEYKRHRYEAGSFRIVIPADTYGIGKVKKDMLIFVLDDHVNDSLVITSVKNDGRNVTLSGYDMKILLGWRITLFPQSEIAAGTYGYDVATGSTGQIIRHYIDYNMVTPSDTDRKIYGLTFGSMSGGIVDDTYMSRMQPVSEVVEALCKNADIGYSVDIVREGNTTGYVVNIPTESDRTNGQTVNPKAVFADYTLNTDSITVEDNCIDRKNVIWAINGGTADTATVTSVSNNADGSSAAASGFERRETVTTVNCETADVEIYARKDVKENHDKTEIVMESSIYDDYGTRYNVGDKVTVIRSGHAYDRRIQSVTKHCSGSSKTVQIVIEEIAEKKIIKRMNHDVSENREEAVTQRLDHTPAGSGGVGEDLGNGNIRFNSDTNTITGDNSHHSTVFGENNSLVDAQVCLVGGVRNTLNTCAYTTVNGEDNSVIGSIAADVHGDRNTVNDSYHTSVHGLYNQLYSDSNDSSANGNSNIMSNAASSSVLGDNNRLTNSRRSSVIGQNNIIDHAENCLIIGYSGNIDLQNTGVKIGVAYGSGALKFKVDGNGDVTARNYITSSADYGEYFEWADGNPDGDDRMGLLVEQIGDKIAPAQGTEFFGAITARAGVIGNAYEDYWHGKFLTDVYGRPMTDEDGKQMLSPEFDPDRVYVPRSQRPEWDVVGLVGRIIIRDDGSCVPGGYVSARQGVATSCYAVTRARVLRRLDATHIEVLMK